MTGAVAAAALVLLSGLGDLPAPPAVAPGAVAPPVLPRSSIQKFAVVIGRNQPPRPGLPLLRYADDDAVRWAVVLRTLGAQVELLAEVDAESRRLYGPAIGAAASPTVENLRRAMQRLGAGMEQARAQGAGAVFYFVYAGHGDVDANGDGFVSLASGPFFRRDLEDEVLRRSSAQANHVIVDACRSYYFVYERGGGGVRRPARGYFVGGAAARFRNTGFLLSSSSGAPSHEWEEYQSGVFSHEVRSALLGGADADNDGQITYREVAAFLQVANRPVRNERYRPAFVAAGPQGARDLLMDLRGANGGGELHLPAAAGRHVMEDAVGVRWADVHPGPRQAVTLRVPSVPWAGRFFLREVRSGLEYELPAGARLQLANLTRRTYTPALRGAAHEAFTQLFTEPFDGSAVDALPAATEYVSVSAEALASVVEEPEARGELRLGAGAPLGHAGLAISAAPSSGLSVGLGLGLRREAYDRGYGLTAALLLDARLLTRRAWSAGVGGGLSAADHEQVWRYERAGHPTELVGFRWSKALRAHAGVNAAFNWGRWTLRAEAGAAYFLQPPRCLFVSESVSYDEPCDAAAPRPPQEYGLEERRLLPYASLMLLSPLLGAVAPAGGAETEDVGTSGGALAGAARPSAALIAVDEDARSDAAGATPTALLWPRHGIGAAVGEILVSPRGTHVNLVPQIAFAPTSWLQLTAGGAGWPVDGGARLVGMAAVKLRLVARGRVHLAGLASAAGSEDPTARDRLFLGGVVFSACWTGDCRSLASWVIAGGIEQHGLGDGALDGRAVLVTGPSVAVALLPYVKAVGELVFAWPELRETLRAELGARFHGRHFFLQLGGRFLPARTTPTVAVGARW